MSIHQRPPRGVSPEVMSRGAPSPEDLLATLVLRPRTQNSLRRFVARAAVQGDWTFGRLLQIPGFGRRALTDVLQALEARGHGPAPPIPEHRHVDDEIAEVLSARPGRRPHLQTPLLERALEVIGQKLPASERDIARRLRTARLARGAVDLGQVERASRFCHGPLPFAVLRREGLVLAVAPEAMGIASVVHSLAVRAVVSSGLARADRIAFQARTEDLGLVVDVLSAKDSFRWLDRERGWFWFATEASRLVKTIVRVLTVTGAVSLAELSPALFRRFPPDYAPTRKALRELCRQIGEVEVSGNTVTLRGAAGTRSSLPDREQTLLDLFRRWGPRIDGHELVSICAGLGIGVAALGRHLRNSPLVVEPQPGVFRLIGT